MSLSLLGWSDEFECDSNLVEFAARIIAIHRSHLRAITINGEINIQFSNSFSEPLAVGDWIITSPLFKNEHHEPAAFVKELVPRKSKISRVGAEDNGKEQLIAANVDNVFIVTSINQDFNLNRLQRFLLVVKEGLANPIIVLSKADLEPSYIEVAKELSEKIGGDILILPTSVKSEIGVDKIKSLIPAGSTSVFVGSSGVGKSSLVNLLLNEKIQLTKEIRKADGKGRHTTTSRNMFFIPDGGMIIDTPGIRGVSVFGSENHLPDTFHEIEQLMTQCKFSNCTHITEPGCAILKALKDNDLKEKEWENYIQLSEEIAANNIKLAKKNSIDPKKNRKLTQKDYKAKKKNKGRR